MIALRLLSHHLVALPILHIFITIILSVVSPYHQELIIALLRHRHPPPRAAPTTFPLRLIHHRLCDRQLRIRCHFLVAQGFGYRRLTEYVDQFAEAGLIRLHRLHEARFRPITDAGRGSISITSLVYWAAL